MAENQLIATSIKSLPLLHKGKVRDIYEIDDKHLLIVTTDRLSAFDIVMAEPIPFKGFVLTQMADFWFNKLSFVVANHLSGISPESVVAENEVIQVKNRAIVTRKLKALPIEAIVRGYLSGSGWKDYQKIQSLCGIKLPQGLKESAKLSEPIFTPSSKEAVGRHDENISYEECEARVGKDIASRIKEISIKLYQEASTFALTKGIIIADTKFEFGLDDENHLVLIDEILTPDSSRFWPLDQYHEGASQPSFDKQFIRDWLENSGWNKTPPPPSLPEDVIRKTSEKYLEAFKKLTGQDIKK
ncbi:phosphoribosylaminoimidazolesuccinocarboxamide synthase [Candidatus Methylopumilus planktonicus]|uniref:phosphoribosylaminoimidazolesuccinocarboxamide synthase n=1 Tax=Candidatus Methylopumilus planktonicus TaxID=1581557 RepID=UPI00111FF201|nr:phosphoribosylaminoimidazolesuccinocarboxamide synthase [Candidatus Methylopumilus planktonicus]QDD07299.1 phosphoribosylaminoimidazolesuccinocarboxamide synthase [Candidatus Methylopumilus planktonicus]QDD08628.1 phosphoribosylaminoimidazolesuccinocarboxamide synthase [Candidatus Methylopumilus planktonicus]QDD09951.1 phosphoribosylaminoimidazolesuccinocarboxamide synthase [Candidatus Methylopumilus planktonicus]